MKTKLIAAEKRQLKADRKYLIEQFKINPSGWLVQKYCTPAKKDKASILARFDKIEGKRLAERIEQIERIFAAPDIKSISMQIEWKNNRTWGANPTATAEFSLSDGAWLRFSSGSIGGCGYDKGSTAFAQAVNQCLSFNKLIAKGARKIEKLYGHGKTGLSGGVGVECYYGIFTALGYKMTKVASGKMFDAWTIERTK